MREPWSRAVWRLFALWLALSGALWWGGALLLSAVAPLLSAAMHLIAPEWTSSVRIDEARAAVLFDARVGAPIELAPGFTLATGTSMPSEASIAHALVPLVIYLTALFAIPAGSYTKLGWRVLIAVAGTLAVLVLTTPFQLVGLVDMAIVNRAAELGGEMAEPWRLTWMLFLEGGGRWLLPLVLALPGLAATAARLRSGPRYAARGPFHQ